LAWQVVRVRRKAVAVYFDQALPTNPGLALDAAIANFFAGKGDNSAINSVSSSSGH
jgi:hypothetical protein